MTDAILGPDGKPAGASPDAQGAPPSDDPAPSAHPEGGKTFDGSAEQARALVADILGQLQAVVPGAALVIVTFPPDYKPGRPGVVTGGIMGQSVLETLAALDMYAEQAKAGITAQAMMIPHTKDQPRIMPVGAVPPDIRNVPDRVRRGRRG